MPTANPRWHRISPDLLVPLFSATAFDQLLQWQSRHLALSCVVLMVLNTAAVGFGCFTFFSLYADKSALERYKDSLTAFERAVIGISAFMAAVGFMWWLVPFTAVTQMGVQDTWFIPGAGAYFMCYTAVVASSIASNEALTLQEEPFFKWGNTVVTSLSFSFSYTFLILTLPHWQPSFMAARPLAIACLCAFYLPLRLFLLLRPPFHRLESLTFLVSFGFLLIKLLGYV